MRVLITGSRGWTDRLLIGNTLIEYHQTDAAGFDLVDQPTLVSGACPTGADHVAEVAARFLGWPIERHPADWDVHGRSAGFRRNAEMVALGADVCLAFISDCTSPRCDKPQPHPSHGASHTADLAEKAGIPTRRFTSTGA